MFFLVCHVVLAINVFQSTAKPGGFVYLELKSLEKVCDKACNYQLEIWVNCDAKTNSSDCKYGYVKTGTFLSTITGTTFNNSLGNALSNPLLFNFTIFQGTIGVKIYAIDQSGSKIQEYTHHKPYYPKNYHKQQWENITMTASPSKMKISYLVFCNEHYYGPACSVGCLPGKTYNCDENTGKKLCIAGWLGPQCNCSPTPQNTCNIGTGEKICYRPWYGSNCDRKCTSVNNSITGYICGSSGQKICLSGWYGKDCNETTQVFYTSQFVLSPTPKGPLQMTLPITSEMTSQITSQTTSQITSEITSQMTSYNMSKITSLRTSHILFLSTSEKTSELTSQLKLKLRTSMFTKLSKTKTRESCTLTLSSAKTVHVDGKHSTSTFANHSPVAKTSNIKPLSSNHPNVGTSTSQVTASQVDSIPPTPSSSVIHYNPGVAKARKRNLDIWWIILVVLIVIITLIVSGLLTLKYKTRNYRVCHSQSEIQLKFHKKEDINGNEVKEEEKNTLDTIGPDNRNTKLTNDVPV